MYNYNNGVINKIITSAGLPAVNWLETRGVTNIAIIIGAAWVQIGLCVVVFLAGLQSIPQEMYEAASIDGATPSQQLKNITIPMMASSITINVITTTIAAFKAYELPYLISKGLPGHSTLLITQRIFFFGFQAFDYGRGSALSVVLQVGSYKLRHGKRIFKMAPLHHHFELSGMHEAKIVSMYSIVTAVCSALCVLLYLIPR